MNHIKKPEHLSDNESLDRFRKLGVSKAVISVVSEMGFTEPTEIQRKSVPLALSGRDVIAKAATGSGKTFAFAARIIQHTDLNQGIQALILAPTRELAIQDRLAIKSFSKYKKLRISAVYGGVSLYQQIKVLKNANIVVATPGRLLDHINRKTIDLSSVKILVLDEADRMLDMGFLKDVKKIIKKCPKKRQTLLFSATISPAVTKLAQQYMQNPQEVFAESYVDSDKLSQVYYDVPDHFKFSVLAHLLKNEKVKLVMVFCNTRRNVDFVAKNLNHIGINAIAIHGGYNQSKRTKTMDIFQSQNVRVLVCTDVAARGLDIPEVSHIYNYDIPYESDKYVHRIGRTARAGNEGTVINIVGRKDHSNFRNVRDHHNFSINRQKTPDISQIKTVAAKQRYVRRGKSRRKKPNKYNKKSNKRNKHSKNRKRHSHSKRRR